MSPKGAGAVDDHGLNLGYAAGVRRSLDHLGSILRPGERIVAGAQGFLEGRPGLVIATTNRFMFVYRDETPIDSPYEEITRFRAKVGIVASDLEIEDANGVASIRQIHPRSRLADLAGILQKGPGAAPGAPLPGAPAPSAAKKPPAPGAPAPPAGQKAPAPSGATEKPVPSGATEKPTPAEAKETSGQAAPGSPAAPRPASSFPSPTGDRKGSGWKPKLRSKISPLAPRHDEAVASTGPVPAPPNPITRAPSAGIGGGTGPVSPPVTGAPQPTQSTSPGAPAAGVPGPSGPAPSSPSPTGDPKGSAWQPKLGVIGSPGESPAPIPLASRGGALTNPKKSVPLPLADQLLPGEWVVATFADLTATTEGHEKEASASAAVTNRRLLLLTPSGTPVEAWPLQAVEVEESPGGGRARLVGGIDLEFTSSELAAGFAEAMRNASGLLGS